MYNIVKIESKIRHTLADKIRYFIFSINIKEILSNIKLPSYNELVPSFLLVPMVSHWLLPISAELNLYVSILGVPVYLLNIFYLIYIVSYKNPIGQKNCLQQRFMVRILCIIFWCLTVIVTLANFAMPPLPIIFNAYPIIWLAPLMAFFPLSKEQIQKTRYIMAFALVVICLEVILYSTGTLVYETDSLDTLSGQEYAGGIMRISTTIGAATGTGIIISWLGALCLSVYRFRRSIKWALFFLSTVAVFYTVTRGAIILWVAYCAYYFYIHYFKRRSIRKRLSAIAIIIVAIAILNGFSVFDAIINRNASLAENKYTGRDVHIENSIKIIEESYLLGVGAAMMFPEKSIQHIVVPQHKEASHNVYLIIAGETGLIGLLLFMGIIFSLLLNTTRRNTLPVFLRLCLLINFNTEGTLHRAEFISLFLFMLMTVQKNIYK